MISTLVLASVLLAGVPGMGPYPVFTAGSPNGVDDLPALQALTDAANDIGGGTIILPNRGAPWHISTQWKVYSNTTVIGIGHPTIITAGHGINTYGNPAEYITIDGINLIGPGLPNGFAAITEDGGGNLLRQYITIKNCVIDGYNFGIWSFWFQTDTIVEHNVFKNVTYGIYAGGIVYWQIDGNLFADGAQTIISAFNGHDNSITNNKLEGNKGYVQVGISLLISNSPQVDDASNTGTPGALPSEGPSRYIIDHNTIVNTHAEGIMLEELVGQAHLDDGTATSGTTVTLVDSTKTWTTNAWFNREVWIATGTGLGQWRNITSNTATTLTVDRAWTIIPDATSKYEVGRAIKGNVISNNTIQNAGYDGILCYGPCFGNSITGNTVNNFSWNSTDVVAGIRVDATNANAVAGNRAITLGNSITGNTVRGPGGSTGISLDMIEYSPTDSASMFNLVTGNVVSDVIIGIKANQQAHSTVTGNNISYVTTGIQEMGAYSDYNNFTNNNTYAVSGTAIVKVGQHSTP